MRSHIDKPDGGVYCGENSLTLFVGKTCKKCQRSVDKMRKLLEDAVDAVQDELTAAGPEEVRDHPAYQSKKKLVDRINKFLNGAQSAENTEQAKET